MITRQDIKIAIEYLGGKIDALRLNPQKVELDLTSKAIEKLQEIDVREMNVLIGSMQKIGDGQVKSTTELIAALQSFEKATKDDTRVVEVLRTSQNLQRQMLTALEKMKTELKPEKDDKEYRMLQAVEKAIKGIKLEEKEVDMKPLGRLADIMTRMEAAQKATDKAYREQMQTMTAAIKAIPGQIKLSVPKEFKLEENQLRSIRSGGSSAIAMAPLDAPNGGLYAGRKVVASAGTAEALAATSTRCENIIITAESDNSGIIAVGDANVVAAEGSQQGVILTPLGSITVKVGDLSKIYIDATVTGDGVTFAYER